MDNDKSAKCYFYDHTTFEMEQVIVMDQAKDCLTVHYKTGDH